MTTDGHISHPELSDQDMHAALQKAAFNYGVDKLAAEMGLSAGTLYNKLSLNPDCRHYTGLDEFIHILRHSQNLQPLQVLCRLFGGVFYRLPTLDCVSDSALLDIVNRVHAEGGDVHRAMSDALEDGVVTSDEFRNVDHELMDWIAAIIELRGRFRSLVVMPAGQETAPCN